MATGEKYQTTSTLLYDQAMVELEAGDLLQASEKLWGAAAQALKSVAERRGLKHDSHANLYAVLRELRKDETDSRLRSQLDAANALHINFYENWLNEGEIRERANDVRLFIDRLAQIR